MCWTNQSVMLYSIAQFRAEISKISEVSTENVNMLHRLNVLTAFILVFYSDNTYVMTLLRFLRSIKDLKWLM